MSIKTKTLAAAAIAALAVPGAALADGSAKSHGKSSQAKSHQKAKGPKGKAFTIKGVDLANLAVDAEQKLTGPLTLDPTSANKHARAFLKLSKADLRGEKTVSLGTAADAVKVTYEGLTATDAIQATDVVKVIGKVSGTTLDIRKIVVTRGETTTTS